MDRNTTTTARRGVTLSARVARLRRYFRSPKGYLTVALVVLAALSAPFAGLGGAAVVAGCAIAGSVATEALLDRLETRAWSFPSSALLTGLILGLVLGPFEPWYAAAIAGVLAINAKHLLRLGRFHIFNPAAVGLMAAYWLFASGQSWWGALPDLPAPAIIVLVVAGYLVAERANKLPAALSFLGAYAVLFTGTALLGDAAAVGEVFRPPFINAALFFACFMVTDPPTSPVQFRDQAWFGVLVGAAAWAVYESTHAIYFLPAAILAGNVAWAAWRYAVAARARARRSARAVQARG